MQRLILFIIVLIGSSGALPAEEHFSAITGPNSYKNLSVFLIHGTNRIPGKKFLTLQEALQRKVVIVHETGEVNELEISNMSRKYDVFIMSGEILKGGKQDRVVQYNYIVPPKTSKMKIASFCVESGRWEQRGREKADSFSSSDHLIASKDLRKSVKRKKSQSQVWESVSRMQGKLGQNIGSVRGRSETSLQLTLEHKKVKEAQREYMQRLGGILENEDDAIGYVFVINGSINSAEIFGSPVLFAKLWPKLIRASIIEAVSEYEKRKEYKSLGVKDIRVFLDTAEKGRRISDKRVSRRTKMIERESADAHLFETFDSRGGEWINKSYLAK